MMHSSTHTLPKLSARRVPTFIFRISMTSSREALKFDPTQGKLRPKLYQY
jgi:hypothetical protein